MLTQSAVMALTSLLVFEGLIFDGLRQARMAALDQILEPAAQGFLDVVCVEQGRWGDEFDGEVIQRAPISVIASWCAWVM
jgi:hypothetical protein